MVKDNWKVASDSADILGDFVIEARTLLDQTESTFLALETELTQEGIASAFRAFHTIKGVSGFLELTVIMALAHRIESVLAKVRDGAAPPPGFVDLVLGAIDRMRACLVYAANPEGEPPDVAAFLAQLDGGHAHPAAAAPPPVAAVAVVAAPPVVVAAPVVAVEAAPVEAPGEPALAVVKAQPRAAAAPAEETVRVDLGKMDHIIDLVGELAIAQAQVVAHPDLKGVSSTLARALSQVSRVARDLQRASLAMRMVPIKGTFDRIARIARDTARNLDKALRFTTEGAHTELDRTMAEAIYEPLVHMVRNAIDHGLEPTAAQRTAAGKPEAGTLELRAFHEGGSVIIELIDDGRGLDRPRILARAKERGLVPADAQPTNAEIDQMIFLPGFSTAEKVTSVSGRGVGMDVVKTNIERVRGRVDVFSEPGKGSRFRVQLPLTLAIVDGLLFSLGEQRYIVPATFVRDVFRPTPEQITTVQGRGELVSVRGRSYVIRRLSRELPGGDPNLSPTRGVLIMVDGEHPVCLLVDSLIGKQEVVVKGLGAMFADVHGLTGGAILGDGRIALILDLPTLLARRYAA